MTPLRLFMFHAITLLLITPQAALAQAGSPEQPTDQPAARSGRGRSARVPHPSERGPNVPIVIQLRHADCFEVERLLDGVFGSYPSFAIALTNSVVFAGPEDVHADALKLIAEVDKPATEGSGMDIARIRLMHRPPEDVARQISSIYGNRDMRIGVDEGRGWILLRGTESQLSSAKQIVQELDTPAGSASIEFAFLRASDGGEMEGSAIPPDLADVANQLTHLGTLSMMGRLSTVAVEGEEFTVQGAISDARQFEIWGRLESSPDDGGVRVKIGARMFLSEKQAEEQEQPAEDTGQKRSVRRRQARPVGFEIETTVATQRGHYVVLGSAPTGWDSGESAILVLHVRESH